MDCISVAGLDFRAAVRSFAEHVCEVLEEALPALGTLETRNYNLSA